MQNIQHKYIDRMPQKSPMLFVDSIIDIKEGQYCKVKKCVSRNDPFFQGHFPDKPIMPGCLLIESMAQASELIFIAKDDFVDTKLTSVFLAKVKNAIFRKPVVPGDILIIETSVKRNFGSMFEVEAFIYVEDEKVAESNLVLAIQPQF